MCQNPWPTPPVHPRRRGLLHSLRLFIPAGRTTARHVLKSLELIRRTFGHIETIVTDNASCFRSVTLTEHLEAIGSVQDGHPWNIPRRTD